jgi:hypothetical protein
MKAETPATPPASANTTTAKAAQAEAVSTARNYIGPLPAPLMGGLQPCGCTEFADKLTREQQDFVIETVPDAASWYQE